MYTAKIYVEDQVFVIEDEDEVIITSRPMPTRIYPNPGREVLMSKEANQEAWSRLYFLVQAANRGLK